MTKEHLHQFASKHDGCCIVTLIYDELGFGNPHVFPPDEPMNDIPNRGPWDYYMCDEPESFDFDAYNIHQTCSHCKGTGLGKETIGCEWCGGSLVECDPDVLAADHDGHDT